MTMINVSRVKCKSWLIIVTQLVIKFIGCDAIYWFMKLFDQGICNLCDFNIFNNSLLHLQHSLDVILPCLDTRVIPLDVNLSLAVLTEPLTACFTLEWLLRIRQMGQLVHFKSC